MPLVQNSVAVRWKTFLGSAFWSAILTALARMLIGENNLCFQVVNDDGWIRAITGLIWLWLLLFLFFDSNRIRLILLGCSVIGGAILIPNVHHSKIAAGEVAAIRHIRNLVQEIDTYKKQHPKEGYPPKPPQISSSSYAVKAAKLYKIEYMTFHSDPSGLADGYLIEVTPLWRDCGYIRSFTRTQDGLIHYTLEARPATVLDTAIQ